MIKQCIHRLFLKFSKVSNRVSIGLSPAPSVLQNFSATEVYIKRARKCLSKNMRSHWTTDLDVETLESRRSWASLSELQTVVPFHLTRYEVIELGNANRSNVCVPIYCRFHVC